MDKFRYIRNYDDLVEAFQRDRFGEDYERMKRIADDAFDMNMTSEEKEVVRELNDATIDAEIYMWQRQLEKDPEDYRARAALEDALLAKRLNRR